jgi:uncharacterized LabA/DUF88 family protein
MEEFAEFMTFMDHYMGKISQATEEVMIFLDHSYLHKCLDAQFKRTDLDLTKFALKLTNGRRLKRTYYYTGKIEISPDFWQRINKPKKYDLWKERQTAQQRVLAGLAYKPFIEPRLGRLKFDDFGNPQQKGVDVLIAIDMLRFAIKDNYDVAILVSGDGDFTDIVRLVKDEGRRVEIVTFPDTRSRDLLAACDNFIEINAEYLTGCWEKDITVTTTPTIVKKDIKGDLT